MASKFRTLFPESWLKTEDGSKRKRSRRSLRRRRTHARVLFAFKDGDDAEGMICSWKRPRQGQAAGAGDRSVGEAGWRSVLPQEEAERAQEVGQSRAGGKRGMGQPGEEAAAREGEILRPRAGEQKGKPHGMLGGEGLSDGEVEAGGEACQHSWASSSSRCPGQEPRRGWLAWCGGRVRIPAVLEGETGQSEPEADGPSFPASPPAFSLPSYH